MGTSGDQEDTPLHEAVRYSDEQETLIALKEGHDPNQIGLYQWSPLHEAANIGDLPVLKLLLKFGGDPNRVDQLQACTALHYAASGGHVTCLEALLVAGAQWDKRNQNGETSLHVATGDCVGILRKLGDSKFIMESSSRDTQGEKIPCNTLPASSVRGPGGDTLQSDAETGSDGTLDEISVASVDSLFSSRSPSPASLCRSNSLVLGVPRRPVLGQIQLSFEYNIKKATLKIRVWQLTDLLLPPVETSMINSIYVKSYLLPDKRKETKRKTDEQPVYKQTEKPQKKADITSRSVILKPSSFQFAKCSEYKKVTVEMVQERVVHLEVCILQKYTRRSFVLATWDMPAAEAVKRLVKQSYPLTPRISTELPQNMKVYDGSELTKLSSMTQYNSQPNTRVPSLLSLQDTPYGNVTNRTVSESDLKSIAVTDICVKKTASIEIPIPDEESQEELSQVLQDIAIVKRTASDSWTGVPMKVIDNIEANSQMTVSDIQSVTVHMPHDVITNKEDGCQMYRNAAFDCPADDPHSLESTKRKPRFSLKKHQERILSNINKKEKVKKATRKTIAQESSPRPKPSSWQSDFMEPLERAIDPVTFDDNFGFELDGLYPSAGTTALDMPKVHGENVSKKQDEWMASTSFMTPCELPNIIISSPICEKPKAESVFVAIPPSCCITRNGAEGTTTVVDMPENVTYRLEDDSSIAKTPQRTSGLGSSGSPRKRVEVDSGIELASYRMQRAPSGHVVQPSSGSEAGQEAARLHEKPADLETILL